MTINRCEDYINHMAQAIHLALSYMTAWLLSTFWTTLAHNRRAL